MIKRARYLVFLFGFATPFFTFHSAYSQMLTGFSENLSGADIERGSVSRLAPHLAPSFPVDPRAAQSDVSSSVSVDGSDSIYVSPEFRGSGGSFQAPRQFQAQIHPPIRPVKKTVSPQHLFEGDLDLQALDPSVEVYVLPGQPFPKPVTRTQVLSVLRQPLPVQNVEVLPQPVAAAAAVVSNPRAADAVDLQADDLAYDENNEVVTATGNVVLRQSGRKVTADRIEYTVKDDLVVARGNVVLTDVTGDVYTAEALELRNKLKDGVVQQLQGFLADGSRFTAQSGKRKNANETRMKDAVYTACEICKNDPDADPVWQIKAAEVKHDKEEARVSYKHARLELAGVPVLYAPYFSHSDGSIERKSGFLSPAGGYASELGAFVTNQYYWDIAPDQDMTLGLSVMTEEAPLGSAEYRKRWQDASLSFNGGITRSERVDSFAGQRVQKKAEMRGHVFADAVWDMDEHWRSGVRINWASDDQYLRQYALDSESVLENEVYAERFEGRNYLVGRLLTFQDTRVGESRALDQPEVLPEVMASFIGDPGQVPLIEGRWNVDASFLGLRREGSQQDINRLSLGAGWKRRLVSDYGIVSNLELSSRGDLYSSRDRQIVKLNPRENRTETQTRLFPSAHWEASYPVAQQFENSQMTIEPMVALTASPNMNINEDIPNEDSQDVQIDVSNLFEPNRFPGFDRLEDKSKVTYGVKTGLYGFDGSYASVFLGQSRRLDKDDNPFPEGSGLDEQRSDYVGEVTGNYQNDHILNYRFQLKNIGFASERHEIDLHNRVFDRLSVDTTYLFAKGLAGTDIAQNREQLKMQGKLDLTDEWAFRSGFIQDFGEQDSGLRRYDVGVDYEGQCLGWSLTGQRNFTNDISGESDTEIFFRIGLKNLGEFQSSGLQLGGGR